MDDATLHRNLPGDAVTIEVACPATGPPSIGRGTAEVQAHASSAFTLGASTDMTVAAKGLEGSFNSLEAMFCEDARGSLVPAFRGSATGGHAERKDQSRQGCWNAASERRHAIPPMAVPSRIQDPGNEVYLIIQVKHVLVRYPGLVEEFRITGATSHAMARAPGYVGVPAACSRAAQSRATTRATCSSFVASESAVGSASVSCRGPAPQSNIPW